MPTTTTTHTRLPMSINLPVKTIVKTDPFKTNLVQLMKAKVTIIEMESSPCFAHICPVDAHKSKNDTKPTQKSVCWRDPLILDVFDY